MRAGHASRTAQHNALFRALESARPASRRRIDDPLAVGRGEEDHRSGGRRRAEIVARQHREAPRSDRRAGGELPLREALRVIAQEVAGEIDRLARRIVELDPGLGRLTEGDGLLEGQRLENPRSEHDVVRARPHLVHLDGEDVAAACQVLALQGDRLLERGVSHAPARRRRGVHLSRRHVDTADLDAVQVEHGAIIDHRTQLPVDGAGILLDVLLYPPLHKGV